MSQLIVSDVHEDDALDSHPSVAHLPAYPSSREDYLAWGEWAQVQYEARRMPVLRADFAQSGLSAKARLTVAWRAILGHWAEARSVAPDDAPLIAHYFLTHAQDAPPFVMLAASRLTRACLHSGATSTDVLFLAAAWAWPLRDVDAELSDICWDYLVYAPWQTDPLSYRDMLAAVELHQGFRDGRELLSLVNARREAGARTSARHLLEAVALVQARKERLDQLISYREFAAAPLVEGANDALVRLADLYQEEQADQVHAREVMKRAAELTRSRGLVDFIEDQIWDRPIDEAYRWTESLAHPRQLDLEIDRALSNSQPHDARRLAEAVMVRKFNRLWYGSAIENIPAALERFRRQLAQGPPQDPVARRASEHLALLYARTHHITQHARDFVHSVADSIAYTGKGALLHDARDELEFFYNGSDPYHVLRHETTQLANAGQALSDDERAASDEVSRWFSDRFSGEQRNVLDRLARMIASPVVDAARLAGDLPMLEAICRAAFGMMAERGHAIAGDLTSISLQAAKIRTEYGHGMKLMEYAREVSSVEVKTASVLASATSFLPPGLSLAAHAADLGASLLLAFRAVARIGAVFGRDIHERDGFQFVANAFTVGLSSKDGEGLVSYLGEPDDTLLSSVTIGGVTYASARLIEYMWVAPRASGPRPSEQLIGNLARICGFELSHTAIVRMVPIIGALISGVSTYTFMRMITESAIHVAARDALLVRVNAYEG